MFATLIPLAGAVISILAQTTNVLPPDVASAVSVGSGAVGSAAMFAAMKTPGVVEDLSRLAKSPENMRQYRSSSLWIKIAASVAVSFGTLVDVVAFNWGRAANKT
jgi:hypothetical protein